MASSKKSGLAAVTGTNSSKDAFGTAVNGRLTEVAASAAETVEVAASDAETVEVVASDAETVEVVAAPVVKAKARRPKAVKVLTEAEEWELLVAAEAETKAKAEAKAAAKAAAAAAATAKAEAEAEAEAKVKAVAAAEASAAVAAAASAWAATLAKAEVAAAPKAKDVAAAAAEAKAAATAATTAETAVEAEAFAAVAAKAAAAAEGLRRKAHSAADIAKAAKAKAAAWVVAKPKAPAATAKPGEAPINAVMAEALAKAAADAEAAAAAKAAAPVVAPATAAEVSAEALPPVQFGLGAIPMPTTVRADGLTASVLDAVNRMAEGRLLPLLQIPAEMALMAFYEAQGRAAEVKALIESLGSGGRVIVVLPLQFGGVTHRIGVGTLTSVKVIGSTVELKGVMVVGKSGRLAYEGINTPFAGVLQFDREAVVVEEMEVDPAFSFAPPTLKVVAVKPPVVTPPQTVAPMVAAPAPVLAPVPIHNRDHSRTAADRPIRGNSVVGYSR